MGVRKIGLFGSFKRGQARRKSDIDILVVLEKPTFDSYMEVKFYLEDLFERKVDLVMEETIKPRLRPYILNEVEYA
jgi:predicted nucleotidyltransferase